MPQAKGTFAVHNWEGETYEEHEGAVLSRASLTKTFEGDFQGTSTAELLLAEANNARAYVGMERLDGTMGGASGTFVVMHSASQVTNGDEWLKVNIVAGSGTAGFTGITGSINIVVTEDGGHTYSIEYHLD
ncbi:hypothetical protein BH23ACT12_BH23ACT12_16530 [soil metagenome]